MKIKPYQNKYGHTIFDCPFCDYWGHVRSEIDPFRDLKRHMKNAAKNEALAIMASEGEEGVEKIGREHLDYYKKHTSFKKVVVTETREFDDDMEMA